MHFGTIEANDGDILSAVRTLLNSLVIPTLLKNKDWGKLSTQNGNKALVSNFITGLEDFSKLLESAKANLSETLVTILRTLFNTQIKVKLVKFYYKSSKSYVLVLIPVSS